jgi:metal-responsive CopG/Arc/MetJ family transcriptional regulator
MKIVTVNVPESYLKLIEKSCFCTGITRSELVRQAVRSYLIGEIKLAKRLENELEDNKITRFFDYCINCESKLYTEAGKSHLFHKNIEVFVLRFCCSCYKRFKDTSFDDFSAHIIDNIRKKIKKYKKSRD